MIKIFLRAKHWLMFLLWYGIPMLIQVAFFLKIQPIYNSSGKPDPYAMLQYVNFIPILLVFMFAIQFAWYWSAGVGLQSKVPEHVRLDVKMFKTFSLLSLFGISAFVIFFIYFFNNFMFAFPKPGERPNFDWVLWFFPAIMLLSALMMIASIYIIYFIAKTIKTVELQKEVSFGEFVGEFILIWFFPVGVWFIQPTINKMVEE